jgi:hypothetical protein
MQDRIAAGNIEIRQAIVYLTEIQTVVKGILHLFPTHCIQPFAVIFGENIAVLTPLVTFVSNVPLERKIRFHIVLPHFYVNRIYRTILQNVPGGILSPGISAGWNITCRQHRKPSAFPQVDPMHRRPSHRQQVFQQAYRQSRRQDHKQ